jgi:hypothetical protein
MCVYGNQQVSVEKQIIQLKDGQGTWVHITQKKY